MLRKLAPEAAETAPAFERRGNAEHYKRGAVSAGEVGTPAGSRTEREQEMEELRTDLGVAARRLAALVEINRWLWIINAAVTIIAIIYERYDIVGIAAFTWVLSLVAAAIAKRAEIYVDRAEHLIQS